LPAFSPGAAIPIWRILDAVISSESLTRFVGALMPKQSEMANAAAVLLAVDGSQFGTGAARVAIKLAAEDGARLTVLGALTSGADEGIMGIDARAAEEAEIRAVLEGIAEAARRAGGNARALTRKGSDPAEVIVAVAAETNADAIIVGRRGPRAFALGALGRTTVHVIANALCPVLVTPRAAEPWRRRILFVTDGSPAAEAAAMTLERAEIVGATPIDVLSVQAPGHSPERQAEAPMIVERTVAALRAAGRDAFGHIAMGPTAEEIIRFAAETGADLIVLGSQGRSLLHRAALGSVSEAVIARASSATLVVTARMAQEMRPA
jgi:nucleotide-binding universal stress UspA family protein